jgi:C1A family cysteine protease
VTNTSNNTDGNRLLITIPESFDARTVWPNCIHPILNQGSCDGCWAFGTTSTFTDRICIASNGTITTVALAATRADPGTISQQLELLLPSVLPIQPKTHM